MFIYEFFKILTINKNIFLEVLFEDLTRFFSKIVILRWSRGWEINGFFKSIGFIGPWLRRQRDNLVQE